MTKAAARRFLLGAVDDSERQQIESLFVVDSQAQETILIAEDELVEEYLEGTLSESETAKFVEQYAHGPRQQRKLRIAKTIRDYAQSNALRGQSGSPGFQKPRSFFSLQWPRERRLYIPIAIAAAIVLVVSSVWLAQWNTQRMRDNNRRLFVEQQLAELNTPSNLRENPAQMVSLVLPSVSLRSAKPPDRIAPQMSYRVLELQLLWPQKEEFQSYIAVLRRVGGTETFTIANLHTETHSGNNVVKLRIPAQSLAPGLHHISLRGVARNGTSGWIEEYEFMLDG